MFSMWDSQEDIEKKKLADIEYAKNIYCSQIEKIKREEYVKQLVFEDYVDRIKQHISRYDLWNEMFFKDARLEIGKKTKKERSNLETLTRLIREDFLNNDTNFKIINIISCGMENYDWNVELKGYGKTIAIIIPIMHNITTENIKYAHDGKFGFMVKESESSWDVLELSYKMEDIAKSIKGYFADKINN